MGSNLAIPLQVQTPQPASPLTSIGALMQLRGQMSEIALRSAQVEQARQATANLQEESLQKSRDVADQNNAQALLKDPANSDKFHSGDLSFLNGQVSPEFQNKLQTGVNTALQSESMRRSEDLKLRQSAAETVGTDLASLKQIASRSDGTFDPAVASSMLPDFYAAHGAEIKALGGDPSKLPNSIADEDHFNQLANGVRSLGIMAKAGLDIKGKQAETAEAAGKGAQAQAAADLDSYKLSLLKGSAGNDGTVSALMDKMFAGKPDLRAQADAVYQSGKAAKPLEPGAGVDAVKSFYDEQVGKPQAAVTTQAATLAGDVKRAAAEAAVTEPIRAKAQADAQAYLTQKMGGPLAGVLDAGERAKITSDYLKANEDYAQKAADAKRLADFVAAARSGNQSAAGLMPVAEVRSLVNRVTTPELLAAGGGSIVRRITNGLDKAGTGIPSEETLKDLEGVSALNEQTARDGFAQKIRGMNAISNTKLAEQPPGSAPQFKVGDSVNYNGKPHKVTAIGPDGKLTLAP